MKNFYQSFRLRSISIFVLLLTTSLLMTDFAPTSARLQTSKPNFIFILADDLDLQAAQYMPNLMGQIASRGLTFSNSFVTYSLCCPSRASILTGKYPHNHGVQSNAAPDGGFAKFHSSGEESSTIAVWLQDSGYKTVLMGKYLNGYPGDDIDYVPPGWSEWYAGMEVGGAYGLPYLEYNYTLNENGTLVSYGRDPEDYMTDVLSQKATDFISRTADSDQPFFMYLSTYAPHEPATPSERHEDAFADVDAPRPPSFNEADVSDKPEWVQNLRQFNLVRTTEIDSSFRRRLQSLLAVDEMIAAVIEALSGVGELDNTYILFASDNGFHFGEHRLAQGKDTPYEESIHVPLFVRGPGVPQGETREHFVLNIDYASKFAELAGLIQPDSVDGVSFASLLGSSPTPLGEWRPHFMISDAGFERDGMPAFAGLRTANYLYVEYDSGERELYDLAADPYQLQNIYSSADSELIAELATRLDELRVCAGESCR